MRTRQNSLPNIEDLAKPGEPGLLNLHDFSVLYSRGGTFGRYDTKLAQLNYRLETFSTTDEQDFKYPSDQRPAYGLQRWNKGSRLLTGKDWVASNDFAIIKPNGKIVGFYRDNVLYEGWAEKLPTYFYYRQPGYPASLGHVYLTSDGTQDGQAARRVTVKYPERVMNLPEKRRSFIAEDFPSLVQRIYFKGEWIELRGNSTYGHSLPCSLVAVREEDQIIIALAYRSRNEDLLYLAEELYPEISHYSPKDRNDLSNIGRVLIAQMNEDHPYFRLEGQTWGTWAAEKGYWADRVALFKRMGVYDELVRRGVMTPEKVSDILAGLNEKETPPVWENKPTASSKQEPEFLLYVDPGTSFVLYDKRFLTREQDNKYIYAFGFLRDGGGHGLHVFKIDWDEPYGKLASYSILQVAKDDGQKLYVGGLPSDMFIWDLPEVKRTGDCVKLSKNVLNLKELGRVEQSFRMAHDRYDEKFVLLLEQANSKWD